MVPFIELLEIRCQLNEKNWTSAFHRKRCCVLDSFFIRLMGSKLDL